jgi:hypothetical protein
MNSGKCEDDARVSQQHTVAFNNCFSVMGRSMSLLRLTQSAATSSS